MAKLKPGDIITADFLNRHEEVAEHYFRTKALNTGTLPAYFQNVDPTILNVRNDSGEDVRTGEVLELDGSPVLVADRLMPIVSGFTPDLTRHTWGIALTPITSTKIGEVRVVGVCVAKLSVLDESHKFANRVDDSHVLESAESGPVKIIYKPTGSTPPDERECIVQIADQSTAILRGKTDAAIAKGSQGTVSIWTGSVGSESDSGENVTAHNYFANVASGRWVAVTKIEGYHYLIAAEC